MLAAAYRCRRRRRSSRTDAVMRADRASACCSRPGRRERRHLRRLRPPRRRPEDQRRHRRSCALKDWAERPSAGTGLRAIWSARVHRHNAGDRGGIVLRLQPAADHGPVSTTGGFEALSPGPQRRRRRRRWSRRSPTAGRGRRQAPGARRRADHLPASVPQILHRRSTATRRKALDVPIDEVFDDACRAPSAASTSTTSTLFGRIYRVQLQSEADFRARPEDLRQVFVRSQRRRAWCRSTRS